MPRKDNTGPEGKGPMTGRGLGNCKTPNSKKTNSDGRGQGGQGRTGQGTRQGRAIKK